MKITTILLFSAILTARAGGFAQRVTLSANNVKLGKIFKEIKKQTGYVFFYDARILDGVNQVSVHVKNATVEEVLKESLQGQPLDFSIQQRTVTIVQKLNYYTAASEKTNVSGRHADIIPLASLGIITGKVKDANGNSLAGVSIVVKGTQQGTSTDVNGSFSVNANEGDILEFTIVGYQKTSITVSQNKDLTVVLEIEAILGNEVVVVGYGTQKKSDLTGSVGSVNSKELMQRPAINAEQSLAGRISGVNVATNSGRPGGRTRVSIRGFSSVNATNDPLYVVDGIVSPGGIENIDPNNIESINVLKDASSTAIYGTRGANGVIIITTKRGKETRAHISYDSYVSVNWLPLDRKPRVLNSKEFLFIEEEQYKNANKFDSVGFATGKYKDPIEKRMNYLIGNSLGNRELFKLDGSGVPQPIYDIDWHDMSTRKSISNSHNLSITGGDNLTNYGIFLGYINENGIIKESYATRYNVRAVIDKQIKSWLKVGGSLGYTKMKQGGINDDDGSSAVIRYLVEYVPFIPFKYEDGTYGNSGDYQGLERVDNPLTQAYEIIKNYNANTFQGNTYANFKLLKGLEFTSTFGANIINEINPFFSSSKTITNQSQARINSSESTFWSWSNRFNYTRQINDNQKINILAGAELQGYNLLSWIATTSNLSDNYYQWYNLGSGATPLAPTSTSTAYQMQSYFGRINYILKDKYLFTATGRSDGSSRFGANNKFAFFPSAAAAWRISQEDFLKNNSTISNLKIRATYGLTGNSEIGSYKSQANLMTNAYPFNGNRVSGSVIGLLANPDLRWEKTAQLDLGVDIGLLNNRISLEADYYLKKTRDLLLNAPVPSTSGYTTVTRNIGSMENKGFEFSLNTINIEKGDFSWSTSFNFSSLKNTVTALGEKNEDIIYGNKNLLLLRVGKSANSFYGYVRDGIWGENEKAEAAKYGLLPGDQRILDKNNDGVINGQDQAIIGKGIPDFYGTFSNKFSYKNFDLIVELQYSQGNDVFDNMRNSGEARQGIANSYATVLDAWTPTNQNAVLEQVRPTGAGYAYYMDTRKLQDGSFIRGKNFLLSYTLPKEIISRWKLSNLRFYASAQNLFLITKYSGYDPEVSNYDYEVFSQGENNYSYPKPRTFMLGVNASF